MNLLLQEFQPKDWAGLTTKNHLANFWAQQPQYASKLVGLIHQANLGMSIDTLLDKFPTKYLESDNDFVWELMGPGVKNIPLVKAMINGVDITPADKPGLGGSEFEVVFPENTFFDVNVIQGEKGYYYQLQITGDPTPYGGGQWKYTVRLMTGDLNAFMPYDLLRSGKRFVKVFSPVEDTLSKKGGGVNFTSPFRMRNSFSMIRMEDMIPGNMIKRPIGITLIDQNKKNFTTWLDYHDWQFNTQFMREKNYLLYYSRINRANNGTYLNKGKSGYELRMGAGLKQQIESASTAFYPVDGFNIDWLTRVMLGLSVNKLSKDQRKFVLYTGEWGMYQFHQALERHASLYRPLFDSNRVGISKGNVMSFRGQFLEYMGPNGIEVTLMHDPIKDDPSINIMYHPNGGTAESYVYDILDIGTSDGEPNIQKVSIKGQEYFMGYEPGLRDPFTLDNKVRVMSTGVDGYKIHKAFIGGVMVKDPTRCISIKPNILQL